MTSWLHKLKTKVHSGPLRSQVNQLQGNCELAGKAILQLEIVMGNTGVSHGLPTPVPQENPYPHKGMGFRQVGGFCR